MTHLWPAGIIRNGVVGVEHQSAPKKQHFPIQQ